MIDLLSRIPPGAIGAGLFAVTFLWFVSRPDTRPVPSHMRRERGLLAGGFYTALIMGAVFVACRLMFA